MSLVTKETLDHIHHPQETTLPKIRLASLEDIKPLGKLWSYQRHYHKQWDEIYQTKPIAKAIWKDQIRDQLNQPNHCVLVVENEREEVIGYVHGSYHLWSFSPFEIYGSLNTISVADACQGQGLGKKLLERLLLWFQTQQVQYISLFVDYRNQTALKLYQGLGFQPYQHRLMLNLLNLGKKQQGRT